MNPLKFERMIKKALKDGNIKNKQLEYKADPKKKEQDARRKTLKRKESE